MHLELTEEQRALQQELRTYFEGLATPALEEEMNSGEFGPEYLGAIRKMGTDGRLGVGWPTEYGGQGRSPLEQYIFFEESHRAGVPVPLVTLNTVGPAIMRYGTEEQKARILPSILAGELHVAIGYSEPEAGTDLASLTTRAVRDGDDYVINGQKVFTTGAEMSDYVWLGVRTDPDVPKHKGISIFLVDTSLPGFKVTPTYTVVGHRTNTTYYEDVRVPASMLIGEENKGWRLITTQLNFERSSMVAISMLVRTLEDVVMWAKETRLANGSLVIDQEWVRVHLARVAAKLEALRLMNWRVAWNISNERFEPAHASSVKVLGTEFHNEAYRLLLEVVGEAGALSEGPGTVLRGRLERAYRQALLFTFGGGVNEIQREIIAMMALGMPRIDR